MESLYNIVEMARMNKSQIQNGGDELRYQADRMAAKARKLRRAGKEKEAMAALEEAAKLREQAANWKPEDETVIMTVDKCEVGFEVYSFFARPRKRTLGVYNFREFWTENAGILDRYINYKDYKSNFTNNWFIPAKSNNTGKDVKLAPYWMPRTWRDLMDLIERAYHNKTTDSWEFWRKKTGEEQIEIMVNDPLKWRYPGESAWRQLPVVNM